jgi:hypothetical protein
MRHCKTYEELHPEWKSQVDLLIRKICGKSNIADISIEESDLKSYDLKVTVLKFNTVKGWATIGYLRNDLFRGGIWRLTYKPRLEKGEKSEAGKTGSYL